MDFKKWQLWGIVFTLIVGTLLHFTYEWSGENGIVGIFSAVNESTWEHLKLLAVPMLFFTLIEYLAYGKEYDNFIPVKLLSILVGMAAIVICFYTYVGIIGQHFLWADIGTFVLGVVLAYCLSAMLLQTDCFSSRSANVFAWIGMILILLCLVFFTVQPPHIALFQDPVSGTFGK